MPGFKCSSRTKKQSKRVKHPMQPSKKAEKKAVNHLIEI